MQKTIRFLMVRLGMGKTVFTVVAASVVLSMVITACTTLIFPQLSLFPALVISGVIPLLLATPITWQFCSIIAELEKAERHLKTLAMTDDLTGLANRRKFVETAKGHLSYVRRFGGQVALIILDIDHFKDINDTHGHQMGDAVLQGLSKPLGDQLREVDTLARIGGEEFAILLPHTSVDEAFNVAERIRQSVEERSPELTPTGEKMTISLGISLAEGYEANFEDLFDQADKALYMAKDQGRNRTEISDVWLSETADMPVLRNQ